MWLRMDFFTFGLKNYYFKNAFFVAYRRHLEMWLRMDFLCLCYKITIKVKKCFHKIFPILKFIPFLLYITENTSIPLLKPSFALDRPVSHPFSPLSPRFYSENKKRWRWWVPHFVLFFTSWRVQERLGRFLTGCGEK